MCSSITSKYGQESCYPIVYAWLIYIQKISSQLNYVQVILGEEVATSKLTIFDITKQISDAVQARAEKGRNYYYVIHNRVIIRCTCT
jgi:hypothetical protein